MEYRWFIRASLFFKLVALCLLFFSFLLRYGPYNSTTYDTSICFYIAFGIEVFPVGFGLLLHLAIFIKKMPKRTKGTSCCNCWWLEQCCSPEVRPSLNLSDFFLSMRGFFITFTHFAMGLYLAEHFYTGTQQDKDVAGFYFIISVIQAFQSFRAIFSFSSLEMFGWFEVVLDKILNLLAVHSWLLLTFAFAFYIQFSDFKEIKDEKAWSQDCHAKFRNCTENILKIDPNTEVTNSKVLEDCIDYFKACTQPEPENNAFNGWNVIVKTLSMSAGELGYDDLPNGDGKFVAVLTYSLFVVLVLFVIMNLMTSAAVNDFQEIKNQSMNRNLSKMISTLTWYDDAMEELPGCFRKVLVCKPSKPEMVEEFEVISCEKLGIFERMPGDEALMEFNLNAFIRSGELFIKNEDTAYEECYILVGSTRRFEHYLLNSGRNYIGLDRFSCSYKIAIVEKEYAQEYDTTQYSIKNKWTLVISKNPESGATSQWIVRRKLDNGQMVVLKGKRLTYYDRYSSAPKIM